MTSWHLDGPGTSPRETKRSLLSAVNFAEEDREATEHVESYPRNEISACLDQRTLSKGQRTLILDEEIFMAESDIVALNVGGVRYQIALLRKRTWTELKSGVSSTIPAGFCTSRTTLLSIPGTFFSR